MHRWNNKIYQESYYCVTYTKWLSRDGWWGVWAGPAVVHAHSHRKVHITQDGSRSTALGSRRREAAGVCDCLNIHPRSGRFARSLSFKFEFRTRFDRTTNLKIEFLACIAIIDLNIEYATWERIIDLNVAFGTCMKTIDLKFEFLVLWIVRYFENGSKCDAADAFGLFYGS